MKKLILLSLLAMATIHISAGSSRSTANSTQLRRIPAASQIRRQRSANTTPGRRSEGFSNNPRLNWQHPYKSR